MGSLLNCIKGSRENDKSNINKLDNVEHAILKAKRARDEIKKYIKRMENSSLNQKNLAKENIKKGNRDKAKLCLGRSKAYDVQVDVGRGQLNLLEEQIIQLDQIKVEESAINVLKSGNELLKKLQSEISIDKWENIRDDMNEMRDQQKEIQQFLQNQGISEAEYEDEINEEMEKLMKITGTSNINKEEELPDISKKPKKEIAKESTHKEALLDIE